MAGACDEEKLRELGRNWVKHHRSVLLLLGDAKHNADEPFECARNMAAECSKQAKQMQYVDWADGLRVGWLHSLLGTMYT